MGTEIDIEKNIHGEYIISDNDGNKQRYMGYTKREALTRFKKRFGHAGKHGITVYDFTK